MNAAAPSFEFRYFRLAQGFPFRDLPPMPTVCLLVADEREPPYEYDELVTDLMSIGCRSFMTWGKAAKKFEDILDETIVILSMERGSEALFAATTAHQDESAEDVASFLLEVAIQGEHAIRSCVGFSDDVSANELELRREIPKIVGN